MPCWTLSDYGQPIYVDMAKIEQQSNTRDTALATAESRELIERLVEHAIETANAAEVRERQMLRWTQAGVALAAVAAVASIIAIIISLALGGN